MSFRLRARQSNSGFSRNTTQSMGKPKIRMRATVSRGRKSGS